MSKREKGKRDQLGLSPKRTPSLESQASTTSAASGKGISRKFGGIDGAADLVGPDEGTGGGIIQYGPHLYDVCAVLIYCPKHKKFAMSKIGHGKGYWFPLVGLKSSDGWYAVMCAHIRRVLTVPGIAPPKNFLYFKPPELIHHYRVQVPTYHEFIARIIYSTELNYDNRYPIDCCKDTSDGVRWMTMQELQSASSQMWGPEPAHFANAMRESKEHEIKFSYIEYTLRDACKYLPRELPKTFQDEILKSSGATDKDVLLVFSDFLQHVYPSQYMVFHSFSDFMCKLGWNANDPELGSYFRAFGFSKNNYLSFHEFLLGISAFDKNTSHGEKTGELRCKYIFRYYDTVGDGRLNSEQLKLLIRDSIRARGGNPTEQEVETEYQSSLKIFGISGKECVDEEKLIRAVGKMQLRGTSALFRSSKSVLQAIRVKNVYDAISINETSIGALERNAKKEIRKGSCAKCREKKYTLAMHIVRTDKEGGIVEPQSTDGIHLAKISKEKKAMSVSAFAGENIANVILDTLRDYADSGAIAGLRVRKKVGCKTDTNRADWGNQKCRISMLEKINKLCNDAENLFRREPRVMKVNSPCYVLGDIHGNLHDLMIYERMLWKFGPTCVAANFLFLGDYVDRGEYGVEAILYLLSFKLIAPEKFIMLRGNHEIRTIQMMFTFKTECEAKFGNAVGAKLWETFNRVFDVMPLCAIIDDSIFCAHGGIPSSANKIEELYKIPLPLPDPETQAVSAWEMLWNDPITANEFTEYSEMLRTTAGTSTFRNLQGFLPNTKRGTAYYFSEQAVNKFLSSNHLSHIIRAHEVIPPGYQLHMNGKVITVFSSSKYCGGQNEAAVILVDQEKIRIIRVDTN